MMNKLTDEQLEEIDVLYLEKCQEVNVLKAKVEVLEAKTNSIKKIVDFDNYKKREENNKCYISGAITGTTDYVERFNKAEVKLMSLGYIPINPAKINSMMPVSTSWKEYMEVSLCLLGQCDTIYLMDGLEKSKGARKEYEYAMNHGIKQMRDF